MSQNIEIMSENAVAMPGAAMPAIIDPVAVAAAEEAKALVQAAYTVAMHRPRNVMQARQKILDACKRPGFARKVEYTKPVGKSVITGPSIRFAELAVQQWGNIRVDTTTTFENDEIRKIRVQVLDLETNACFGRVITINKTVERSNPAGREILRERMNTRGNAVYILKATEEELATKEAAAISKIVRNEGLRLIPEDIIDEAIETAKAAIRGEFEKDPQAVIRKLCDSFAELRITPEDLSEYLGCHIDKAKSDQIGDLRKIYTALKTGEARWSDFVNKDDQNQKTSRGTTQTASRLKEKLNSAKAKSQEAPKDNAHDTAPKSAPQTQASEGQTEAKARQPERQNAEAGPAAWQEEKTYLCPKTERTVTDDDCFTCRDKSGCPARA